MQNQTPQPTRKSRAPHLLNRNASTCTPQTRDVCAHHRSARTPSTRCTETPGSVSLVIVSLLLCRQLRSDHYHQANQEQKKLHWAPSSSPKSLSLSPVQSSSEHPIATQSHPCLQTNPTHNLIRTRHPRTSQVATPRTPCHKPYVSATAANPVHCPIPPEHAYHQLQLPVHSPQACMVPIISVSSESQLHSRR